jgi:hypothetical protein
VIGVRADERYGAGGGGGGRYRGPQQESNAAEPGGSLEGEEVAANLPVKVRACSSDPRITEATRRTTSHDEDKIRATAANQILSATLSNFVNTRPNGLILTVEFSDGGTEKYRHTSFAGWQPVDGSLTLGDGVSGSACSSSAG